MFRQCLLPGVVGEFFRIVQHQQFPVLRKSIRRWWGRRIQLGEGRIPFGGERFAHAVAELAQSAEVARIRLERGGPGWRESVDLAGERQRGWMPHQHIRVGDARGIQCQSRTEGEVIDDDRVGRDGFDDRLYRARHPYRLPHEVAKPGLGLEREGVDHSAPGRVEEATQGVVFALRLVFSPDHTGVGPFAELEVQPLETEGFNDGGYRRARGHDDTLAGVSPGGAQGRQRKQVRRIVGADDEQRHDAGTTHSRSPAWAVDTSL